MIERTKAGLAAAAANNRHGGRPRKVDDSTALGLPPVRPDEGILRFQGLTYTAVDITEVPAALAYITEELGYSQAPVVVNNSDDQDHWSGCAGTNSSRHP